jgi:hypothetical protein
MFDLFADKYGDAITPAERDALIDRHADILALADALVEEYANDARCGASSRGADARARDHLPAGGR